MCTVYIQCVHVLLFFYLGEDLVSYMQSEDILKTGDIVCFSLPYILTWLFEG